MNSAILLYVAWALAAVMVYAVVLGLSAYEVRRRHDIRSRRELYISAAFFLTAIASLLSIGVAFIEAGPLFRLGFSALGLGAFLGAGIVMALEYIRRAREMR